MFSQNSKTGILGDKRWKENCLEYQALPVGFANANFSGMLGNPYLTGIKTPKYQQSAPKPQSADEMAVNNAKFLKGSRTENASMLLKAYMKEADKFEPPKISLRNEIDVGEGLYNELERYGREGEFFDYETREDFLKEVRTGVSGPIRRTQLVMNRGDQMVRQSIGTQAGLGKRNYEAEFNSKQLPEQKSILSKLEVALAKQKQLSVNSYAVQAIGSQPQAQVRKNFAELLRIMLVRGVTGINLDEIMPPNAPPTQSALSSGAGSSGAGTSVAGTSTEMSEVPTMQKQSSGTQTELSIKSPGKSTKTTSGDGGTGSST